MGNHHDTLLQLDVNIISMQIILISGQIKPFPLLSDASGIPAGSPPGEDSVKARWRSEVRM
jgi:hypothetical protein